MHLIYLDESGNSGLNLNDPLQPIFVLCALVVPETVWQRLEADLQSAIERQFPAPRPDGFEVHASEVKRGTGFFKGVSLTTRVALRDAWVEIACRHQLKLIYRAIEKSRFQRWLKSTYGEGVFINPQVMAFPFVATVVDEHLRSLPESPLGIFIFDENHQTSPDLEKSVRLLRVIDQPTLKLHRIVESSSLTPAPVCRSSFAICAPTPSRKQRKPSGE